MSVHLADVDGCAMCATDHTEEPLTDDPAVCTCEECQEA